MVDFATKCVKIVPPEGHKDKYGSSAVPIYQTATFKDNEQYDYTRSGNPTRTYLQSHLAKLNDCKFSFALSTGMAALDVIFRLLRPGDEIIAGIDLYGGSDRLIHYNEANAGIKCHFIDTRSVSNVESFMKSHGPEKIKLVLLESPTNPQITIVDLKGIAQAVHALNKETLLVADNTMMSPYLQSPLKFGFDLVYDSATKYLSGHHDIMAGVVYGNDPVLEKRLFHVVNSIGNSLSPTDSSILLKGTKTLALRMDRAQENAQAIAEYLHSLGFKTNYPGLPNYPNKEIHNSVARGYGAVLSFETGDENVSEHIIKSTSIWGVSVSFGCVDSLISMPCRMSHAAISARDRQERGLPEDLIRLAVGIESSKDLIADLEKAFLKAGALRRDETTHKLVRVVPGSSSPALSKPSFVTSAPGKVILFAEHAVVYGVESIAGAIGLRCFCKYSEEPSPKGGLVTLNLENFGFSRTWKLSSLPWGLVTHPKGSAPPGVIDTPLASLLEEVGSHTDSALVKSAVCAFLYLFMHLGHASSKAHATFTITSTIPVSAGLGSSAAFCVAVSHALLVANRHVELSERPSTEDQHVANAWAYVGEKLIHGTPSGVDNTVATLGGLLAFSNGRSLGDPSKQSPPIRESLPFSAGNSLKLLVTDTQVKRDTKSVVAGVAKLHKDDFESTKAILSDIAKVSGDAKSLFSEGVPRETLLKELAGHFSLNHGLLRRLNVSHDTLESIVSMTGDHDLATKLTGSGAGGCAITLIPDDFSQSRLDQLLARLKECGFHVYVTSVGAEGLSLEKK